MKIIDKFLTFTADVALKTASAASGLASIGGLYQEKEPEILRTVVMHHRKKSMLCKWYKNK